MEEVEGDEQRGERFDRVGHVLGGHGRQVNPEALRGHPHDEGADQVVDPEFPGHERAHHRDQDQEGELRLGRVGDDAGREEVEQHGKQPDHRCEHQRREREAQGGSCVKSPGPSPSAAPTAKLVIAVGMR